MLWTRGNARSAGSTVSVIHLGDGAVFGNRYCVVLTRGDTAAKPHTAGIAGLVSPRENLGRYAVSVTLIIIFVFTGVAAVAMHDSNGFFGIFQRKIQYFGYIFFSLLGGCVAFSQGDRIQKHLSG